MIGFVRTLLGIISGIRRYRGMLLSDICRQARKLTLVGVAGYAVFMGVQLYMSSFTGVSDSNMSNLGGSLLAALLTLAGLGMVVASFLYKIILLVSNLDKKMDMLKIYIIEIFVAIFLGTYVILDKVGMRENGEILAIGLAVYYLIAYIYYSYCVHVYREK